MIVVSYENLFRLIWLKVGDDGISWRQSWYIPNRRYHYEYCVTVQVSFVYYPDSQSTRGNPWQQRQLFYGVLLSSRTPASSTKDVGQAFVDRINNLQQNKHLLFVLLMSRPFHCSCSHFQSRRVVIQNLTPTMMRREVIHIEKDQHRRKPLPICNPFFPPLSPT